MSLLRIVTAVLLIFLMFNTGLLTNRSHLMSVLKDYRLIGQALLANFIFVPIFGVLSTRVFQLNDAVATGVLLMAIAPGVPFVVLAAGRLKGGSLGFATVLAFLMPAISVLTVPITAQLVLPSSYAANVSVGNALQTLVLFQLIPLVIGIFTADHVPPPVLRPLERSTSIIVAIALLAVLVLLLPTVIRALGSVFGSRGLMSILVVVLLSVAIGWALGGPLSEYRRTLSIATALRNIGLCAFIATSDFPGTLVPPTVITYLLIQAIVCAIVGAYYRRGTKSIAAAPT